MDIRFLLKQFYHYTAADIRETPGGTVGETYRIDDLYFLKLYDTNLVITERYRKHLGEQLLVLDLLHQQSALRNNICYPIKTADGAYYFEFQNLIGVMFQFIPGRTLGFDKPYTSEVIEQLSFLLKNLHSLDTTPFWGICPKEDFDLSFCDSLIELTEHKAGLLPASFEQIVIQYKSCWKDKAEEAKQNAEKFKELKPDFVLCHTDIHGGNLILDHAGKLFIIDWENVILAPREADLFAFCEHDYFSCFDTGADRELLRYYIIRRDLEDIWEFLNSTVHGEYRAAELEEVYCHLTRIAAHLTCV